MKFSCFLFIPRLHSLFHVCILYSMSAFFIPRLHSLCHVCILYSTCILYSMSAFFIPRLHSLFHVCILYSTSAFFIPVQSVTVTRPVPCTRESVIAWRSQSLTWRQADVAVRRSSPGDAATRASRATGTCRSLTKTAVKVWVWLHIDVWNIIWVVMIRMC